MSYFLGEKWYSGGEEVVCCKGKRYAGEQMSHSGECGIFWENSGISLEKTSRLGERSGILWETMSNFGERVVVVRRECHISEREVLFLGSK